MCISDGCKFRFIHQLKYEMKIPEMKIEINIEINIPEINLSDDEVVRGQLLGMSPLLGQLTSRMLARCCMQVFKDCWSLVAQHHPTRLGDTAGNGNAVNDIAELGAFAQ